MKKCVFVLCIVYTFLCRCAGQYNYTPVYPELKGDALFEKVRDDFSPSTVIEYAFARDTLFLKIDAVNRNLSCIYTNLTLPIPEGSDPTIAVFLNGNINGINTEHVYPLSLGTENTNAQSDMHHLYPSRVKTNADRGNEPYGESPDNSTIKWYRDKDELTSKPSKDIDEYSEQGIGLFEPRESVKGDIARSIFYIYTIYRDEVKAVNPEFFEIQKSTLCNWHLNDAVDEKEWKRTQAIAKYQGNKNPFVLDCSLVARMYCNQIAAECKALSSDESFLNKNEVVFDMQNQLLMLYKSGKFNVSLVDLLGTQIKHFNFSNQSEEAVLINLESIPSGFYAVIIEHNGDRQVLKIMVTH